MSYREQIAERLAAVGVDLDLLQADGPRCGGCLFWEPERGGTCGARRAEGQIIHTAASALACEDWASVTEGVE